MGNQFRDTIWQCIGSPYLEEAYGLAQAEPTVPAWLTEDYLRTMHAQMHALPRTLESLVLAARAVAKEPLLCVFAKTLYHILAHKEGFKAAFTHFALPEAPRGADTLAYDCVAIFPIVAHVRPTWEQLSRRGVEEDILRASLDWADRLFFEASEKAGKPILPAESFRSYKVAIYINHLTIGCLRFEIHENSARPVRIFKNSRGELMPLLENTTLHRSGYILGTAGFTDEEGAYAANFQETEKAYEGYTLDIRTSLAMKRRQRLLKTEWTQVYASGQTALKIHIPYGSKLTKEGCSAAYVRAREVFGRCFAEYDFSCFLICCWMLSPELRDILSAGSNILAFQDDFLIYPVLDTGLATLLYVYGIEGKALSEIDFAALPEQNSLQRGIKQKLLAGHYMHQFGGYIPW